MAQQQQPFVKNTADEDQVKAAGKKVNSLRRRELEDVRLIMETNFGRRYIWRQLGICGVFQSSFNNSGSVTAFNEGQRNVGLKLLADVQQFPVLYLKMMDENNTIEKENLDD